MVAPHVGHKVARRPESSVCTPMEEISQGILLSEKETRCSMAHVDDYFVFKRGKNKNIYWNWLVSSNVPKQLTKVVCYGEGVGWRDGVGRLLIVQPFVLLCPLMHVNVLPVQKEKHFIISFLI